MICSYAHIHQQKTYVVLDLEQLKPRRNEKLDVCVLTSTSAITHELYESEHIDYWSMSISILLGQQSSLFILQRHLSVIVLCGEQFQDHWLAIQNSVILAVFFKSFRKGPVVCRGLDVNLSGKVAKKRLWHGKEVATPTMCSPSYRCVRNLSPSTAKAAATAYTHINVAIVTRSHFGNAKPKFHMNCWPTISINDRSCQQRCITEARKHF